MNKYLIGAVILFASWQSAPSAAADKPIVAPPAPTVQQQELGAMQQLCQLAQWANRQQADTICPYFLDKFSKAADASVKEKKP
jgi:hypothetical protein